MQGSGICIDHACSVVATANHIQMLLGRANLEIAGCSTRKVLSLANESDTNKTEVPVGKRALFYDIANDVTFVYAKKPAHHKSGVPYSYHFYAGQKVEVAGYYNGKFQTREAHVIGADVPLQIGKARLEDNILLDVDLKPGQSGSAVIDEDGNLLGMIILKCGVRSKNGDVPVSVALPVITIARALVRLDPALGSAVFNNIPEEEPKPEQTPEELYQENDLPEDTSPVIPVLSAVPSEVPNSVSRLRAKSEAASKMMVDFITKQCLVQGTGKSMCHELSVVDGRQTFRKIDKNGELGELTDSIPVQKHGVWTQSDWADTLGELADNSWVFQGSVDDKYVFTYKSAAEDDRCYYEEYSNGTSPFSGGHAGWKGSVACFEEVLTDKDFNVLSVFTEMHPPDGCVTQLVQTAIYYDWIKLEGLKSPILLPVKERITAKVQGQKDLWYANVSWTDYEKFRTEHKIRF